MPIANADYFGVHGAALTARARRVELLASNIANAATPGYKARDVDFGAALARAEGAGPMQATSPLHFRAAAGLSAGTPGYRVPISPSLDGNTVELATEQALFGENAARYQSTLSFLNGRISSIMAALKE